MGGYVAVVGKRQYLAGRWWVGSSSAAAGRLANNTCSGILVVVGRQAWHNGWQ